MDLMESMYLRRKLRMFWFLWVGTMAGTVALRGVRASIGASFYHVASLLILGVGRLAAWLANKAPSRQHVA